MKVKKIVILLLIITVILGMNVTVKAEADSYKISLNPDKTTLKQGDTLTISLEVKNINIESGEKGIGAYEGIIEYDANIFQDLKMTGNDEWDKPLENEGKFASVKSDGVCTNEDQEIAKITLKVKSDAEEGETIIKIKEFGASNGLVNISTDDVSLTVKIKIESTGNIIDLNNAVDNNLIEDNKIENNTVDNNTIDNNTVENDVEDDNTIDNNTINKNNVNENKTNSQNNKISSNVSGSGSSTIKNGILPYAGASSLFVIFALICIISGIYSYIRYKTTY